MKHYRPAQQARVFPVHAYLKRFVALLLGKSEKELHTSTFQEGARGACSCRYEEHFDGAFAAFVFEVEVDATTRPYRFSHHRPLADSKLGTGGPWKNPDKFSQPYSPSHCTRGRAWVCVCVCVWERDYVCARACVCVCVWERERGRESVCVCAPAYVCVCVVPVEIGLT